MPHLTTDIAQHDQQQPHVDEPDYGARTTPTDALISLDATLRRLGESEDSELQMCELPSSTLRAVSLLLLDYRRRLHDEVAERVITLPSVRERDHALEAFENVCRCTVVTLNIIEDALGGPQ